MSTINLWSVIRADIPVIVSGKAKEAIAKAAGLAMKRMAVKMVMEASRLTRQEYNIKAKEAKAGVYYKRKWVRNSLRGLGISINVRSRRYGLQYFDAKPKRIVYIRKVWKDWRRKKKVEKRYKVTGVTAKMRKGSARSVVRRAFMLPGNSGVFMRRKKNAPYPKRPLTKLGSLSLYETIKANTDKDVIIKAGLSSFRKNWKANFKQLVTRRFKIRLKSG